MLQRRGFDACEIDFEGGFWMEYPWAERFGELAREAGIALSDHAPCRQHAGRQDEARYLAKRETKGRTSQEHQ